jgi:predicted ATP-dependent endonuclease of OLD family
MLIETINAGVVSHNFDQETLSLKITNEIRENKETLRSLIQEANGSAGSQLSNKVDTHIRQIECLLNDNNDDLESYALTRLFIHERITEILQEYTKLKDRTLKIEERITALCELISEFIEPKYLSELDGSVSIYGGEDDREIDFTVLSTGEKQLLIILFKIFLSGNSLITLDEPELSLHISWQQKLLEAVNKLNPNAQLIVATHSPEIAAFNNAEVVSFER